MKRDVARLAAVARLLPAKGRRRLLTGFALACLAVLSGIGLLGLSGWFITATAIAGLTVATAATFDVFSPAAAIRFLALARTAARYGERLTTHDATLRALAALRERLFLAWSAPVAARRLALQPRRLLFRLTADIDALDSLHLRLLLPIGVALLTGGVLAIALALIEPAIGMMAAGLLLAAGLAIPFVLTRLGVRPSRRRGVALEAMRARTIDLVAGQAELQLAGRLRAQAVAVMAADAYAARQEDRLNRLETGATFAFGLASTLLLAGLLLALGEAAQSGRIGAPLAALGILAALAAFEPFAALRRGALEFGRTLLASRRIAPSLAAEAGGRPAPPPRPPQGFAFRLEAVTARHPGARTPTLQDITLALPQGEVLALVGSSGAGKSTILAVLAGEIAPETGRVTRLAAVLLTQHSELFSDSIGENLRLADPEADEDRLRLALDGAGVAAHVASLSEGIDNRLGEGGAGLSTGQARRLAFARLLLHGAPLWLLDEPTEGLDDATARDLLYRIRDAGGARSIVIATHLHREAALADRIALVEDGRLMAVATRGQPHFDALLARLRTGQPDRAVAATPLSGHPTEARPWN